MRLGWVVAPAPVLRKMNLGKQGQDLASSTLTQRFVVEYMRRHDWREHVGRLNEIYRRRRDAMLTALEEEMPAEATWTRPRGGLFVWATLPSYLDTEGRAGQGDAGLPGRLRPGGTAAFLDGRGRHSMRLNYSGVPEATISEGVRRLGMVVGEMADLHRALSPGAEEVR